MEPEYCNKRYFENDIEPEPPSVNTIPSHRHESNEDDNSETEYEH